MSTKINIKTSSNALRERTEILKNYYDDIRKYNVLTRDEEVRYFNMYKYGTTQEKSYAYNYIISSNQRFVIGVAKRYATDENILDLIEEGNIGLLEAFHKYDVELGNKFISYAVHYIRRSITNYLVKHGSIVHRSNNHKIYHLASKARSVFFQRNMRQPSLEELMELLNNEYNAQLCDVNDLTDMHIMSIDANYDSDTEIHGDDYTLYNTYTSNQNECVKKQENDFNSFIVKKMINDLSEKEQIIIKMSFGIGYDREYEINEIAEVVDICTERVRQLKKSALDKIKKSYMRELATIKS